MHKYMKKIGLAATGLALGMTPAIMTPAVVFAQESADTDTEATPETAAPTSATTPEQDAELQSWPVDKQAAFKTWPVDTQTYFWSLSSQRQKLFWALSDSDKVTLSTMEEPQRESIWAQIESRASAPGD